MTHPRPPAAIRRSVRRAAGVVAALLLPLAALAESDLPDPRGWGVLQLSGGMSQQGAPAFLLGAGFAVVDTGTLRLDILGRAGGARRKRVEIAIPDATSGGDLGVTALALEFALARRTGRTELWAGAGVAMAVPTVTYEVACTDWFFSTDCDGGTMEDETSGEAVSGPTAAIGARLALGSRALLEVEARYQRRGSSLVAEGLKATVGGFSALLGLVFRLGDPAPGGSGRRPDPRPPAQPAQEAEAPPSLERAPVEGVAVEREPEPVAPAPAAPDEASLAACPSGAPRDFHLHPQTRFRCFADPVRGGFRCESVAADGEHAEPSTCERACRKGSDACPVGSASGAACALCVEGCARPREVPCTAEYGGTPEGEACRIEAGRWGSDAVRTVPATCPITPSSPPSP